VAGYYVDAELEGLETGGSVKGSARFMFDDNPIDVLREALEKEANIERMSERWLAGRDINTVEPLRGEPFLEWLLLPTEEAKQLSLKSRSRPLTRLKTQSFGGSGPSTLTSPTTSGATCGGSRSGS
jgi:hypothetical protein